MIPAWGDRAAVAFQSRPKPRGSSTSRASRATSQTPSSSSAVLESARDSGRLVAPGLVLGLQGAELADGVGPPFRAAAGGPSGARPSGRARRPTPLRNGAH